MKIFKTAVFLLILQLGHSQCPMSVVQSNNNKCYTLTFSSLADVPANPPMIAVNNTDDNSVLICDGDDATLSNDGLSYVYKGCGGANGNCSNGSGDNLTGSLSIDGGPECFYTNGALPVEFINLTGRLTDGGIEIQFSTASEINISHFIVQRSDNRLIWSDISILHALEATDQERNYRLKDQLPLQGINYYRIKEVDKDGSINYSRLIQVQSNRKLDNYDLFPNPSTGSFNIESLDGHTPRYIYLIDGKGTEIFRQTYEKDHGHVIQLDINLNPGYYFLSIVNDFGNVTKKLVIK